MLLWVCFWTSFNYNSLWLLKEYLDLVCPKCANHSNKYSGKYLNSLLSMVNNCKRDRLRCLKYINNLGV